VGVEELRPPVGGASSREPHESSVGQASRLSRKGLFFVCFVCFVGPPSLGSFGGTEVSGQKSETLNCARGVPLRSRLLRPSSAVACYGGWRGRGTRSHPDTWDIRSVWVIFCLRAARSGLQKRSAPEPIFPNTLCPGFHPGSQRFPQRPSIDDRTD
jgi:hypothetical protein